MFQLDRIVDADLEQCSLETSRYLISWFGGRPWLAERKLVLPTEDFFARGDDSGSKCARRLFEDVKRHAGLADVECR